MRYVPFKVVVLRSWFLFELTKQLTNQLFVVDGFIVLKQDLMVTLITIKLASCQRIQTISRFNVNKDEGKPIENRK